MSTEQELIKNIDAEFEFYPVSAGAIDGASPEVDDYRADLAGKALHDILDFNLDYHSDMFTCMELSGVALLMKPILIYVAKGKSNGNLEDGLNYLICNGPFMELAQYLNSTPLDLILDVAMYIVERDDHYSTYSEEVIAINKFREKLTRPSI